MSNIRAAAVRLSNGTLIEECADGSRVVLPGGATVEGRPHDNDAYRATAQALGYGDDRLAMCRDHDPLHARLCDWLGLPDSFALRNAAGILDPADVPKAQAEEDAVLAVQKFIHLVKGNEAFASFSTCAAGPDSNWLSKGNRYPTLYPPSSTAARSEA